MYYQQYYPVDVLNGPGTRCTLFVSGCEHACRGCYNQATWRTDSGHLFTESLIIQIINDLNDQRIKRHGLSLTGGDPLHPKNCDEILDLVIRVKENTQNKSIWLWTGYELEKLSYKQRKIVERVDVLVDGPFIQSQYSAELAFRGSSNQRIIENPSRRLSHGIIMMDES